MGLLVVKGGTSITQIEQQLFHLLIGTSMWNYPLWFLVAFFVCKCVFDWVMQIAQGEKHGECILVIAAVMCFVAGLYLASIRKEYGFFYPFRADVGITMVPFILIGYYSRRYFKRMEEMPVLKLLMFASVLLIVNVFSFHYNTLVSVNSSDYGNPILFLIGAVSGSYYVIAFCLITCRIRVFEKILSWFGRNSLMIMCSHAIALMFIAKVLLLVNRFVGISFALLDFIKFVCCVLVMVILCLQMCYVKKIQWVVKILGN